MLYWRSLLAIILWISSLVYGDINSVILNNLGLLKEQLTRNVNDEEDVFLKSRLDYVQWSLEHLLNSTASQPRTVGEFFWLISNTTSLAYDNLISEELIYDKLRSISSLADNLSLHQEDWPAARRVIVASVALRCLRYGPYEAGVQQQTIERLLLQLYNQHKNAATRKAVVEFAHVSKSGGTTFCQLAKRNGCKTESFHPNVNCLIRKFGDQPRYTNGSVHNALRGRNRTRCNQPIKPLRRRSDISCGERRRWLTGRGYHLYANEYTALGGAVRPALAHPCRNMLTVLQVRHPHTRIVSHIKHMWHGYASHCGPDRETVFFAAGHDTPTWLALMPAPLNNYLIRSLLGEAVFQLPVGAINREHLALARLHLVSQYDVLLVLEDAVQSVAAMKYGLGWTTFDLHANEAHKDAESGLPLDMETLYEHNSLDLELYGYSNVVAKVDGIVYDVAATAAAEVARVGQARSLGVEHERGLLDAGWGAAADVEVEEMREVGGAADGSGGVQVRRKGDLGGSGGGTGMDGGSMWGALRRRRSLQQAAARAVHPGYGLVQSGGL